MGIKWHDLFGMSHAQSVEVATLLLFILMVVVIAFPVAFLLERQHHRLAFVERVLLRLLLREDGRTLRVCLYRFARE